MIAIAALPLFAYGVFMLLFNTIMKESRRLLYLLLPLLSLSCSTYTPPEEYERSAVIPSKRQLSHIGKIAMHVSADVPNVEYYKAGDPVVGTAAAALGLGILPLTYLFDRRDRIR